MARATKAERESRSMMAARLWIAAELVGQVWRDANCPDGLVVVLKRMEGDLEAVAEFRDPSERREAPIEA